MDLLPFSKLPSSNVIEIIKKSDDVAFVRTLQTCRGLDELIEQMKEKPRIRTSAYLAVFGYFDTIKKKVMFDIPCVNNNRRTGYNLRPRKRAVTCELTPREQEDQEVYYTKRPSAEARQSGQVGSLPMSELRFRRSNRDHGYHHRLTAEQLGERLQFFKFDTVTIDINDNQGRVTHPKRLLVAHEILKVFPFIQADMLTLWDTENEDLLDKTTLAAEKYLHVKKMCLEGPPRHTYDSYGQINKLKIDVDSLEELRGTCAKDDLPTVYNGLITKWKNCKTALKYVKLHLTDRPAGTFQDSPVFLKTQYYSGHDVFHYIYHNNRWAVTLCAGIFTHIFYFCDITDCEGCECQTDFCFKKLMEFISSRTQFQDAIDWGSVIDEWNGYEEKTMDKLGALIQVHLEEHNPQNRFARPQLARVALRRLR